MNVSIQGAHTGTTVNPTSRVRKVLSIGVGVCCGHFGELLQGTFSSSSKHLHRALVSLPAPHVRSIVTVTIRPGANRIFAPTGLTKVISAIHAYRRRHIISSSHDVEVNVSSTIPCGIGMGSSTADIVATIHGLDQAYSRSSTTDDMIAITLEAEDACDPGMIDGFPSLFAQRDGLVLERLPAKLPPMVIKAFDLAPDDQFLTDETPPAQYEEGHVATFDALWARLRGAVAIGDLQELAQVATASAEINQTFFPKPHFDCFTALGRHTGALGTTVSHSGTVAGLIYSPSQVWRSSWTAPFNEFCVETGATQIDDIRI